MVCERYFCMRVAKPEELKAQASPVLTARVSETELRKWFPVPFQEITDPEATPEPSKGALIRLDAGYYAVLYFGETSKQLVIESPSTVDPSDVLAAVFREVPLPRSRVLWHRPDAKLPAVRRSAALARSPRKTKTRPASKGKSFSHSKRSQDSPGESKRKQRRPTLRRSRRAAVRRPALPRLAQRDPTRRAAACDEVARGSAKLL